MAQTSLNSGAPRKILLATDLSARSDRAFERAVTIAQHQSAQLIIVHVFEELDESTLSYDRPVGPSWQRPPDLVAIAKQRIRHGLRADLGDAVQNSTLMIEEGDPADVIERIAISERVDLIVTGTAGERLFASRPVVLGRTVEKLLRRMPVPILIVRNRTRSSYQHVVVATDFSPCPPKRCRWHCDSSRTKAYICCMPLRRPIPPLLPIRASTRRPTERSTRAISRISLPRSMSRKLTWAGSFH